MAGHGPGCGYIKTLKVATARKPSSGPTLDWVGNKRKFLHCNACGTDFLHKFQRCPFCNTSKEQATEVER